jgi:hypothetical protein
LNLKEQTAKRKQEARAETEGREQSKAEGADGRRTKKGRYQF